MRKFKRFLVGIIATAAVLATAACGKKEVEVEEDQYQYVATSNFMNLEKVEKDNTNSYINVMNSDKGIVEYLEIINGDNEGVGKIYLHQDSLTSDEKKVIELKLSEESKSISDLYPYYLFTTKEGDYLLTYSKYSEDGEKYYSETFDKDGNCKGFKDFSAAIESLGLNYISNTTMGEDGNLYFCGDEGISSITPEGKEGIKITIDGWVDTMFKATDGSIYVGLYERTTDSMKYSVKKIDTENKSLVETKISNESTGSRSYKPLDENHLFISTGTQASSVDLTTGEDTLLWSWMDIDYVNSYPDAVWMNDDGTYSFVLRNYDLENTVRMEVVNVKKEEVTDENRREKVVFGAMSYLNDNIIKSISSFNKTNGKYKIVVKNYYEDYGYENAEAMLKADISEGKVDFIDTDLFNTSLANKKTFEDLTQYIENDPDFSNEAIFSNILEASKINGKLYYISPSFWITSLIGSADKVGSGSSWTVDEFMKLREENPDSDFMTYATKENILSYLLYYGGTEFMDALGSKCNFDTEDFRKILKVANTFPDEINYDEYNDWEFIREGKVFLSVIYLSDFDQISIYDKLFNGNYNIIGFPTSTGCGHRIIFNDNYSIIAKSKHKDGAWNFIKSLFSDSQFENLDYMNGFPLKRSQFQSVVDSAMNSNKSGGVTYRNGADDYIEIGAVSQAEVDKIKEIIESTNSMITINEKVIEIVFEEAKPYFAGSKSVEETTDTIQKRVSLYLSETN